MQIGDVTTQTLQAALRGLHARRNATEQNIANVETPGYLAKTVDFESSLAAAIAKGDPASASASTGTSSAPTNLQGNNVAIDDELTGLTQTDLTQKLAVEALNAKYRLLRTAIGA